MSMQSGNVLFSVLCSSDDLLLVVPSFLSKLVCELDLKSTVRPQVTPHH